MLEYDDRVKHWYYPNTTKPMIWLSNQCFYAHVAGVLSNLGIDARDATVPERNTAITHCRQIAYWKHVAYMDSRVHLRIS